MRLLDAIFSFMNFVSKISREYERIKQDEEKAKKSRILGAKSITYTLVGSAVLALLIWAGITCFARIQADLSDIVYMILGIICIIAGVVALLSGLLHGLSYFIYQLRLNRRAIGWVAMILWLVCLVALIVVTIFFCRQYL